MSGAIAEVHWSPTHDDRFLTWGSDISLYQLRRSESVDPSAPSSENTPNNVVVSSALGQSQIVQSQQSSVPCCSVSSTVLLNNLCATDQPRSASGAMASGNPASVLSDEFNGGCCAPNWSTDVNLPISSTTTAVLLAAETRFQYIRCVAPSFRQNGELVVAVGLANGKVGLCNFAQQVEANTEFVPKQSRPCTCLAWHQHETNVLAVGLDRNRSDHCISIWDTARGVPKEKAILNQIGLSETAHSMCWDNHSRVLFAGMSLKFLRVFDFRHATPLVSTLNTRHIHGLTMCPSGRYMSSHVDNLVSLWDMRHFDQPVRIYPMEKNVASVSWCSTRQSTLCVVQRDTAQLKLFDLHNSANEPQTVLCEPFAVKRIMSPFFVPQTTSGQQRAGSVSSASGTLPLGASASQCQSPDAGAFQQQQQPPLRGPTLAGLSWHPRSVERLLALSGSGQIVDFTVQQRVAITFDTYNNLCGSLGMNMRCLRQSQTTRAAIAAAERAAAEAAAAATAPATVIPIYAVGLAAQMAQMQLAGGGQGGGLGAGQTMVQPVQEAVEADGEDRGTPDVLDLFYRRALKEYGKMNDIQRNGNLAENDALIPVWQLIAQTSSTPSPTAAAAASNGTVSNNPAAGNNNINNNSANSATTASSAASAAGNNANGGNGASDTCFAGLCEILGISTSQDAAPMYGSETVLLYWQEYPTAPPLKMFRNEARLTSQQLCGWTFDVTKPPSVQSFCLQVAATGGEFTRAAMIACMQQQVGTAIEVLQMGANHLPDSNLQMAAMGLSGLSFDRDTKWRAQCKMVRQQLRDPYLRALFAFLAPDGDPNFESILCETTISVADRVAFACQFLCDAKLAEYIKRLIAECHATGNLCGLLLTGARRAGVDLLQSFIDHSEDVQTAALIAVRFLPSDLFASDQVQFWVDSYRDLLDVWSLWEHRAHLDIIIGQLRRPPRFQRSVYLLCTFCGKSVSACLAEETRQRAATGASNYNKMSSCPNCRKPLPRCSLCLLHMGTTTGWPPAAGGGPTAGAPGMVSATTTTATASATATVPAPAISTPTTTPSATAAPPTAAQSTQSVPPPPSAGTVAGGVAVVIPSVAGVEWQSRPFQRWFSWCQTCRHGGHTEHMTEWFELHSECPVASCTCKCYALDLAVPQYNSVTSI